MQKKFKQRQTSPFAVIYALLLTAFSASAVQAVPANDNFANAQTIANTGTTGSATGSNVGATAEAGEPKHAFYGGPAVSVWYKWTAPSSGWFTFDTFGSNFSVLLAIYTGSSVNALTEINSTPSLGPDWPSGVRVRLLAVSGTTYYVAVDGQYVNGSPTPATGTVSLHWYTAPANDYFANAQALTGASGTVNSSSLKSIYEGLEPGFTGILMYDGIWYKWTAPASGNASFNTNGSNYNTALSVFTGSAVNSLTSVAANNDVSATDLTSAVTFPVTAGTQYYVRVCSGFTDPSGTGGNVTLNWVTTAPPAVPALSNVSFGSLNSTAPTFPSGATSLVLQQKLTSQSAGSFFDIATVTAAGTVSVVTRLDTAISYDFRYVAKGPSILDTAGAVSSATTGVTAPVFSNKTPSSVTLTSPALPAGVSSFILQRAVGTAPNFGAIPTTGLLTWLKADGISGLVDGASVSSWLDVSAAKNNASQSNGIFMPVWTHDTATGRPVVRFDNLTVDGGFRKSKGMVLPRQTYDFTGGLTAFVVTKSPSSTGDMNYFTFGSAQTGFGSGGYLATDDVTFKKSGASNLSYDFYKGTGLAPNPSATASISPYNGDFELFGVVQPGGSPYSPANITFLNNGQIVGNGLSSVPALMERYLSHIGRITSSDASYVGDIAEIIIYNTALTDTSRRTVEDYLLKKYGLGGVSASTTDALSWTNLASGIAGNTTTLDSTRAAGTSYYYRYQSVTGAVVTASGMPAYLPPAPSAPGVPVFGNVGATSIRTTAPALPANASYMLLERRLTSAADIDSNYVLVADNLLASTLTWDRGLTPSTSYSYRFIAVGPGGQTAGASAAQSTLASTSNTLGKPLAPIVVSVSATSIVVKTPTWPTNATSLTLMGKFSDAPDDNYEAINGGIQPNTTITIYTVTGHALRPEIQYSFLFQAVGAAGAVNGDQVDVWTRPLHTQSPGAPSFVQEDTHSVDVKAPGIPAGALSLTLQYSLGDDLHFVDVAGGDDIAANDVFTVSGLTTDSTYYFRYKAVGPFDTAIGEERPITMSAPPAAPLTAPSFTSITATTANTVIPAQPSGADALALEFQDVLHTEIPYSAYNRGAVSADGIIQLVDGRGNRSFPGDPLPIMGMVPGTTYNARWVAIKYLAGGMGQPFRTPGPVGTLVMGASTDPAVPSAVQFLNVGQTALDVLMPALPARATSLRLKMKLASDPALHYYPSDAAPGTYAAGATVHITGLTADTDYQFQSEADNATAATLGPISGVSMGADPPAAPGAPVFSNLTESSVSVTAPAMPIRARSLLLQVKLNGQNDASYVDVDTVYLGGTVTSVESLLPGTVYIFRYGAIGVGGTTFGTTGSITTGTRVISWDPATGIFCNGIRSPIVGATMKVNTENTLLSYLAYDLDRMDSALTTTVSGVTTTVTSSSFKSDPCTYTWSATGGTSTFKNGVNTGKNPVWIPTTTGTYTITLVVDDQNGNNKTTAETGSRNDTAVSAGDPPQVYSVNVTVIP